MAWNTITAGMTLTPARLNGIGAGLPPVVKSANESVTSSTTLQNDDELLAALVANARYYISGLLIANHPSGATPGLKMGFTWPTGATANIWFGRTLTLGANQFFVTTSGGSNTFPGAAADETILIGGYIVTGGTAGNLQFQFAQGTSSGSAVTVKAGSSLLVLRAA